MMADGKGKVRKEMETMQHADNGASTPKLTELGTQGQDARPGLIDPANTGQLVTSKV